MRPRGCMVARTHARQNTLQCKRETHSHNTATLIIPHEGSEGRGGGAPPVNRKNAFPRPGDPCRLDNCGLEPFFRPRVLTLHVCSYPLKTAPSSVSKEHVPTKYPLQLPGGSPIPCRNLLKTFWYCSVHVPRPNFPSVSSPPRTTGGQP